MYTRLWHKTNNFNVFINKGVLVVVMKRKETISTSEFLRLGKRRNAECFARFNKPVRQFLKIAKNTFQVPGRQRQTRRSLFAYHVLTPINISRIRHASYF